MQGLTTLLLALALCQEAPLPPPDLNAMVAAPGRLPFGKTGGKPLNCGKQPGSRRKPETLPIHAVTKSSSSLRVYLPRKSATIRPKRGSNWRCTGESPHSRKPTANCARTLCCSPTSARREAISTGASPCCKECLPWW